MKVTVLGIRDYRFEDEKSGDLKSGVTLYASYPDASVTGLAADKFSISDTLGYGDLVRSLEQDQEVDLDFNQRGKVCGLSL